MINILDFEEEEENNDEFEVERPYNEDLVRVSLQEKALFINSKIRAIVSQIDFRQAQNIQLEVPLDIDLETEIGISIYEMAIQDPDGFHSLIEAHLDTLRLFHGIKPDIISATTGKNFTTQRKGILLTFDFFHTAKGAVE